MRPVDQGHDRIHKIIRGQHRSHGELPIVAEWLEVLELRFRLQTNARHHYRHEQIGEIRHREFRFGCAWRIVLEIIDEKSLQRLSQAFVLNDGMPLAIIGLQGANGLRIVVERCDVWLVRALPVATGQPEGRVVPNSDFDVVS